MTEHSDRRDVWADVVGQGEVVEALRQAVEAAGRIVACAEVGHGAMTHAWLFTGPPGSGRSVAARAFAAALQCRDYGCGECHDCRTAQGGSHADVHVVVPEGLSIAVGEMRDIVLTAARRPTGGRWQIVIIEDADRLTEAASNALLKAVEEPPERTVFLLCAPSTHRDDVAVTIRSRCRLIALRTPPSAAVAEVLTRRDGIDPRDATWAAHAAQGHIGRARRLARDPQSRERRRAVLEIPTSVTSMDACFAAADYLLTAADEESSRVSAELDASETEALKHALGAGGTGKGTGGAVRGMAGALKALERRQKSRSTRNHRDALDRALVDLTGFYRDVLTVQFGASVEACHPDFARKAGWLAERLSPEAVLVRLDAVLACREALGLNVKPRVAVEAMTVAMQIPSR